MTEAIEENARLLAMSKTDYYRLKNGQVIEAPTYPTSAKVLSLEELRALAPDTAITAKYYSACRGGVARHKLTVGQIILPKAEAPTTPEVTTPPWLKCPKCGGRLYRVPGAIYEGEQQYSHFYRISDVFRGLSTCNYIAKVKLADLSKIPKATTEIASLSWYSISELKQMCQQKGLSTEGSKEDLIRRLRRL